MKQSFFNFKLESNYSIDNYFVSSSNSESYKSITKNEFGHIQKLLIGSKKSGKTHLGFIWKKINNAIIFKDNIEEIVENKKNIFIDNYLENINEEQLFHIINHCHLNNLSILLTSEIELFEYKFHLNDLFSRLKTFNILRINLPDDELIVNIMNKLLYDKQIVINNSEIFQYILKRIDRSYDKIYSLIENIDNLSLEKKRELTIPLIKNLI